MSDEKSKARKLVSKHYAELFVQIGKDFGFFCFRCGSVCDLELDHIKPVSKGGQTTLGNLQLLCEGCNCIKHDKEISYREDALRRIGRVKFDIRWDESSYRRNIRQGPVPHDPAKKNREQKSRDVLRLLLDPVWRDRSDRWIAEECQVSHPFVAKLRKQIQSAIERVKKND